MRINMETEPIRFTWDNISKFAALCFIAGGIYVTVESTNTKMSTLESSFSKAIDNQTESNAKLSQSILVLNITMVRLEESLESRNQDIKEIKSTLYSHANNINTNHDEIIRLQDHN
jgi:hypothetical protein